MELTPTDIHAEYLMHRSDYFACSARTILETYHVDNGEHDRVHLNRSDFWPALVQPVSTGFAAEDSSH